MRLQMMLHSTFEATSIIYQNDMATRIRKKDLQFLLHGSIQGSTSRPRAATVSVEPEQCRPRKEIKYLRQLLRGISEDWENISIRQEQFHCSLIQWRIDFNRKYLMKVVTQGKRSLTEVRPRFD